MNELVALRLIQLKGAVEVLPGHVDAGFVQQSPLGWRLTSDGLQRLEVLLAAERCAVTELDAERIHEEFRVLDARAKAAITRWQTNRRSPAAALRLVMRDAAGVFALLVGFAPRLQTYIDGLTNCVTEIGAGDEAAIASLRRDSFHTIWWRLHEEVLHLTGRVRVD